MRLILTALSLLLALAACPAARGGDPLESLAGYRDAVFQAQALRLARASLQAWTAGVAPSLPTAAMHPSLLRQSGIFVSLEAPGHRVRGCRGTLYPRASRLVDELIANVREASRRDPLHRPIAPGEVERIRIVLCIPGAATEAWPEERWDARFFGVLVGAGARAAVMLPWEAPDSDRQQAWGRKRAGIPGSAAVRLLRFPAVRFAEADAAPAPAVPWRPTSPSVPYW